MPFSDSSMFQKLRSFFSKLLCKFIYEQHYWISFDCVCWRCCLAAVAQTWLRRHCATAPASMTLSASFAQTHVLKLYSDHAVTEPSVFHAASAWRSAYSAALLYPPKLAQVSHPMPISVSETWQVLSRDFLLVLLCVYMRRVKFPIHKSTEIVIPLWVCYIYAWIIAPHILNLQFLSEHADHSSA